MTTIGFDVGKLELVGVRIGKDAKARERYYIANQPKAIDNLLRALGNKYRHIKIGSEATAEYHRLLALSCISKNIPFHLINPIITKQFTRATVRKKKTDISDALVIAKLLRQGEGRLVSKEDFIANKAILRTAGKLSSMRQSLSLIKQRFEDNYCDETEIINIVDTCLSVIEDSVKQIRKQVQTEDKELLQLLCSLPGVGKITANTLMAEIGNIERFNSGKSLIAYAGLDPRVRQSGTLLHHNTKLTKRGSPYLRKALFTAASIGLRHDKELGDYYKKKREEGRSYKEAVIATSRKLTNRVYAVWKRRRVYVKAQT